MRNVNVKTTFRKGAKWHKMRVFKVWTYDDTAEMLLQSFASILNGALRIRCRRFPHLARVQNAMRVFHFNPKRSRR